MQGPALSRWKYLGTKTKIRHYFDKPLGNIAICGLSPSWFIGPSEGWKADREGLTSRRVCLRCRRIMSIKKVMSK